MAQNSFQPDLTERPFACKAERFFPFTRTTLYHAWTQGLDSWFAAKGSLMMNVRVNEAFYFETVFKPEQAKEPTRHPHYGRFLDLVENQLIEMTWVTGDGGTEGAETILRLELHEGDGNTLLKLSHTGFKSENSRNIHEYAWSYVLDQLEKFLEQRYSKLN